MEGIDLRVGQYDGETWQRTIPAPEDVQRNELTLATFNTWFGEPFAAERYQALMDLLACHRPDVILLQEVTPASLSIFLAQPWIRDSYYTSDTDGRTLGRYGVLILSRLAPAAITLLPLPSIMGRHLLVWETQVNGSPLHITTVHLESGQESAAARGAQLSLIFDALREVPNAVITGDFNFCASWTEENDRLDPAYQDVWARLRPDDPGYTEDTAVNRMLYGIKGKHKHVRFDRVLLKGSGWRAESIDLLGTEPIAPDLPDVFPSDHLGLLCRISAH
jgi:tyrosyl-DNA phosphodiesterase 2